MRLSHNLPSLNIYSNYAKAYAKGNDALGRISSGVKVAAAKDSPVGLVKGEKIDLQIRGLQMANRNLQDGSSMLQTAEGGMNEITSVLQRVRELTVQARSGTSTPEDKQTIQTEIDQMIKSVDELSSGTTFNGKNLIGGNAPDYKPIQMTIGSNAFDTVDIPTFDLSSSKLGLNGNYVSGINVTTAAGADSALGVVDAALETIVSARSKYGALENRFDTGVDETDGTSETLTKAYSSIMDADVAAEMMEFSKDNIISDASTAMLAQTNKFPQEVLQILGNIK